MMSWTVDNQLMLYKCMWCVRLDFIIYISLNLINSPHLEIHVNSRELPQVPGAVPVATSRLRRPGAGRPSSGQRPGGAAAAAAVANRVG
jgi:hypothetical protein